MKAIIVALTALSLAFPPSAPTPAERMLPADPMLASIRSVDSTRSARTQIALSGGLFKSLGFAPGDFGTLTMSGRGGTAIGTLRAELSDYPGSITFSSADSEPEVEVRVWPSSGAPVPRYEGRGHVVRIVRGADGTLAVQAIR